MIARASRSLDALPADACPNDNAIVTMVLNPEYLAKFIQKQSLSLGIHAEHNYRGHTLNGPVFDIHYNARIESHNDSRVQELEYAMIITVEAPRVPDMYDQVVRRYATQLQVLQPVIDIPINIR